MASTWWRRTEPPRDPSKSKSKSKKKDPGTSAAGEAAPASAAGALHQAFEEGEMVNPDAI